jgi:hypothetical protein
MASETDRRIHARTPGGWLIVRYDRAGKWYAELPGRARRPLSLAEAVREATAIGAFVYLGVSGGSTFDARVKRASESRQVDPPEESRR